MDGAGELTQIFLVRESIGKTSNTVLFAPLRMLCVLCEKLFQAKLAEGVTLNCQTSFNWT